MKCEIRGLRASQRECVRERKRKREETQVEELPEVSALRISTSPSTFLLSSLFLQLPTISHVGISI